MKAGLFRIRLPFNLIKGGQPACFGFFYCRCFDLDILTSPALFGRCTVPACRNELFWDNLVDVNVDVSFPQRVEPLKLSSSPICLILAVPK